MTCGDEVVSDEFPGAVGVVEIIRVQDDGRLAHVLWESETGQQFHWWSHVDGLEVRGLRGEGGAVA